MRELKASGYRVACRLLDAKWLGVPQTRVRTIFVGVRDDLDREPVHPSPLPYFYSLADALPWLDPKRAKVEGGTGVDHEPRSLDAPAESILVTRSLNLYVEPETDISRFAIGREWSKIEVGEQSERYFRSSSRA